MFIFAMEMKFKLIADGPQISGQRFAHVTYRVNLLRLILSGKCPK